MFWYTGHHIMNVFSIFPLKMFFETTSSKEHFKEGKDQSFVQRCMYFCLFWCQIFHWPWHCKGSWYDLLHQKQHVSAVGVVLKWERNGLAKVFEWASNLKLATSRPQKVVVFFCNAIQRSGLVDIENYFWLAQPAINSPDVLWVDAPHQISHFRAINELINSKPHATSTLHGLNLNKLTLIWF